MSIHEDIQRLAAHLAHEPADPDALERMRRLLERAAAGTELDARVRAAQDALEWASAPEKEGFDSRIEELRGVLDGVCYERDATLLFDVWLGRVGAPERPDSGYFPAPLPEAEREEVARLWSLVEILSARFRQVDLGNIWPREAKIRYRIHSTPSIDVRYSFVGPFGHGQAGSNVHLDVDGESLVEIVVGDVTAIDEERLEQLRTRLQATCERRALLRFLLMIAEARKFRFAGGEAEVSGILEAVLETSSLFIP